MPPYTGPRALEQTDSIRDGPVYCRQDHLTVVVRKAKDKNFRHELADLSRRKIYHRSDLATDEFVGGIVPRDLRRTLFLADLRPKIDP